LEHILFCVLFGLLVGIYFFLWVVAFTLQNSVLTVASTESVVVVHYWVNWVNYLKKT
jgi:hypothetical protein